MIGKYLYGEWLVPIADYYKTVKKRELMYESGIPLIAAILVTLTCGHLEITYRSVIRMIEVLPTTLAILIGFTITCITVLISSSNSNIEFLKAEKTFDRVVGGKLISIYQWLLIVFVYSLITQVFLLAFIFFSAFILQVTTSIWVLYLILIIKVYFILHILLIIIRNITNFYFIFFIGKN